MQAGGLAADLDGCAALEAQLSACGFGGAEDRSRADLVILNTCTVTSSADEDVRQTLRRVHRENPNARILVTGCYAQRAPEELATLPGVAWVVGNSHKTTIPQILTSQLSFENASSDSGSVPFHGQIHVNDIFEQPVVRDRPDVGHGESHPRGGRHPHRRPHLFGHALHRQALYQTGAPDHP